MCVEGAANVRRRRVRAMGVGSMVGGSSGLGSVVEPRQGLGDQIEQDQLGAARLYV